MLTNGKFSHFKWRTVLTPLQEKRMPPTQDEGDSAFHPVGKFGTCPTHVSARFKNFPAQRFVTVCLSQAALCSERVAELVSLSCGVF